MNIMENGNIATNDYFLDKTILIFGGAGSLGTSLVNHYIRKCDKLIIVSRDEAKHWDLKNKIKLLHPNHISKLITVIGDVRDKFKIDNILMAYNPNTIIIAHALKQVDICELNPDESIKTNILGVQNIIESIEFYNKISDSIIDEVCFVSTDKACNPINVYGMCKRISEKLILNVSKHSKSKYVITRYGNVLSSKGSIIPLFLKQAKDNNCDAFTITDERMTRFLMTLDESVKLINDSLIHGAKGELWISKLKSMKIIDLANYFSNNYNKPIKHIGIRPGEKLHESLLTEDESGNCRIFNNYYIVNNCSNQYSTAYTSDQDVMSYTELKSYMDIFLCQNTL
jgi:UDP-N-acetylglucosamine 4,6-dehydratase